MSSVTVATTESSHGHRRPANAIMRGGHGRSGLHRVWLAEAASAYGDMLADSCAIDAGAAR